MAPHTPITRQHLTDPEGAAIADLIAQARRVMARVLQRKTVDALSVQAARSILEHYEAKPAISATIHGPVVLTWGTPSPSLTPLAPSSTSSMTPGPSNGHGPASSSVIDDLESL